MKYTTILTFFIIISLSLTFSQDKIDGINLKEINGKYYSNNNLFSGKAYFFYPTEQPKEIVEFKNGDKKGNITSYYQDKNFLKSNYLDTIKVGDIELKKYNQKNLLDGIVKDTLNTFLKRKNYFNDEIGGDEKWLKLKDKWDKNELKGKKYELVQEYINLGSYHSAAVRYYLKEKSTLDQLEKELQNEKNKPIYSNKVFEDYSINSDKKDGYYTSFYQNGNKKTEGLFKIGAKDELWVEYFENGKIESQIQYTNDSKNGVWKKYNVNGDTLLIDNYKVDIKDGLHKEFAGNIVIEEGTFINGLMTGEWVYRYKDGKGNLKGKGSFINGDGSDIGTTGIPKNGREGIWLLYHPNGKLQAECNYLNGKLEGLRKTYFENGVLESEENYLNGKLEGLYKSYFENGILEAEQNLKQGERNGICKYYHPNGKIEQDGNYLNGEGEGLHKTYYENGILKAEQNLKQGERNGICKYYHPNGKLEQEGNFLNGKTEGLFKFYYENGTLKSEENLKQGERNGICKYYNENGTFKSEENLKQGERNGICKYYHPNGKLEQEGNFLNSKADGLFKFYNENGTFQSEENYKQGERNGICKFYHPNGKLQMAGNFINGKSEGLFKLYYPSGKLNGELNYVNGILNGVVKEYNENGELTGEATYKDGEASNYLSSYIEKATNSYISEMNDQFLNGRTFSQKEYNEHYLCRYCQKTTIKGWKNGYKEDKNGYNSITDDYVLKVYSPKGLREMFRYCSPKCAKEDNE
jgi:antitoxin component YwqK of YwqJK toxin-antitoxin module